MGSESSGVDYAAIGHQDSWRQVVEFINAIRDTDKEALALEQIQEIFTWIPPRVVFRIDAHSILADQVAHGVYIETFIPPEQLNSGTNAALMKKVKLAAACAEREGVRIASLGGFTSIVLEGNTSLLPTSGITTFTTGNTLTAALIAKGVEKACDLHGIELRNSKLLVIGSTGDIGSACVRYFSGKVDTLLLNARKEKILLEQHTRLMQEGQNSVYDKELVNLLPLADIIISVASTPAPLFQMNACMPHTLICDAGYPKNIIADGAGQRDRLWNGGMGQLQGGYEFKPETALAFYQYPAPHVSHGCLIEAMVLAWEKRYEPFSSGRGQITTARMDELWSMAQKHGVGIAPFFNHDGLWTGLNK
jgi:fatty aldehyde-generating acyl-ACP reductase